MESHNAVVRGIRFRWLQAGEGVPVVMLHGIPTAPALWRLVVPLTEGARCLLFELVGYGESIPEGRDRDISVAQQAAYVLGWLNELGIDRAIYVGHDLGGGVAQIAAVSQPARCAGLLLTNAVSYDSWPIPSVAAMQKLGPLLPAMPNAAVKGLLAILYRRGHDQSNRAREALEVYWPAYERHGAAGAYAHQIRSLHRRDTMEVADRLRDLDVPARIVWGAADQFQKISYGERLAWDLNASLHRVEGAKHWVPEDHPQAIADALNSLIMEVT